MYKTPASLKRDGLRTAVKVDSLTKVVSMGSPPKSPTLTDDAGTNPAPVSVKVNGPDPAGARLGLIEVRTGVLRFCASSNRLEIAQARTRTKMENL
jgi:hypothetical protein